MARLSISFDRLSTREKVLVGTMFSLLVGSVVILVALWLGSSVSDLEESISEDRDALRTIYANSGSFLEQREHSERLRRVAEQSADVNLKLAVNEIAKRISFEARNRRGEIEGQKKLADVMQFDQTQETYISKKKKRAKDKKVSDVGYYRRDQPITLSDVVTFDAIYELMEKIEAANEMLFVTNIELTRDFQDGRVARKNAQIVVSTFYYKAAGAEE
ncbi:MAG: hypothetical protein H6744_00675 [Deltaproteobacteria bacterium]|nr:hypothetical protein [Deltaproteobacteria bacterium]MCB9785179.1 hypothetical protein [Deltaproteobacteria bacterium]